MKRVFNKIKIIVLLMVLYFSNLLIAVDQFGNAVMGGDPDETISSRAGRRWPNSLWAKFIDYLFFWQPVKRHVISAIEHSESANRDLLNRI